MGLSLACCIGKCTPNSRLPQDQCDLPQGVIYLIHRYEELTNINPIHTIGNSLTLSSLGLFLSYKASTHVNRLTYTWMTKH